MTATITRLSSITSRLDASIESLARRPDVASEVRHYRERIEDVKSIDDFLKDDRLFRFAMRAFGLGDFAYAKAFMRKVLSEGTDEPAAFANRLADHRYSAFAETFNFARYGEAATIFDRTRQGTIDRYLRQVLEEEVGLENESLRLALYFERTVPGINDPLDILKDRALTKVVYTTLGLPATTSVMSIDKQAALISSRIDFAQFRTPEGISRFISRFAGLADASAAPRQSSATLLLSGSRASLFSTDLLLAIQSSRIGRGSS